MSERNTVVRSLHDLGLAAWFGGSLAGAVGFNGAAADVPDEKLRLRVANAAWARWTPVNLVGIAAHLVGGVGILYANRDRVAAQEGVGTSTIAKAALTGAALAVTGYSRVLEQPRVFRTGFLLVLCCFLAVQPSIVNFLRCAVSES